MPDPASLLSAEIGSARLEVCVADITTLAVDSIVNAANGLSLDDYGWGTSLGTILDENCASPQK